MPLVEILVGAAGPALSKTALRLSTRDQQLETDAGGMLIDALAKLIPDLRARGEAQRQLASDGEKAAESLEFIFDYSLGLQFGISVGTNYGG